MSSDAFTKLKEDRAALHAMPVQLELVASKANVAALKDMLHMSGDQVRPEGRHSSQQRGKYAHLNLCDDSRSDLYATWQSHWNI